MKKIILLLTLVVSLQAGAQSSLGNGDYLNINNIKAYFEPNGTLFLPYPDLGFEVPTGSGSSTIFSGWLIMGGFGAGSVLKSSLYFLPGPLDAMGNYDGAYCYNFRRVWKIKKCDIDRYSEWVTSGSLGPNPVDSAGMEAIYTWPAYNSSGEALAPFIDVNANTIYEPLLGEVPEIKGDQAIFFVYNDKGGAASGTPSIGIEFHCMAYSYNCTNNTPVFNTVFTNYKLVYKSSFLLDSVFIGNFTDFDIGSPNDDYVGCDVGRGAYFGYNGDLVDDNPPVGMIPYGANPPAQAVVFLKGPLADPNGIDDPATSTPNGTGYGDAIADNERLGMSRFLYYNNDASVTGNPNGGLEWYQYLSGSWKDGTPWTYGGTGHLTGIPCHYIYPGSSDPMGFGTSMVPQATWDEVTEGNVPADRRGVGSYGPFTIQPGQQYEVDFAYVFGRATSGGNLASVIVMREYIDSVRAQFGAAGCGCDGLTAINNLETEESFILYPNPSSDILNIETSLKDFTIQIFDARGRLVLKKGRSFGFQTIQIHGLKSGIYLLNLSTEKGSVSKRFIRE